MNKYLTSIINANNELYELKIKNKKLSDENEQLKKQLDYLQNSIINAIKHQKTELQVKALKEIIQDYNEWMLGHKSDDGMIKYCKNCKHLGLDGMFGLICDASGNNKNYDCPKYEEDGDVE